MSQIQCISVKTMMAFVSKIGNMSTRLLPQYASITNRFAILLSKMTLQSYFTSSISDFSYIYMMSRFKHNFFKEKKLRAHIMITLKIHSKNY